MRKAVFLAFSTIFISLSVSLSAFTAGVLYTENRYELLFEDWVLISADAKQTIGAYSVFGNPFGKNTHVPCLVINALLKGVPASEYAFCMTPRQAKILKGKNLGRIGATIGRDAGNFIIDGVMPNSPAQKAGLKPGDIIVGLDGKTLHEIGEELGKRQGIDSQDVVFYITGKPGTSITIKIIRAGEGVKELTLIREGINLKTVDSSLITLSNGVRVGYIKMYGWGIEEENEPTAKDVINALKTFRRQKVAGIIVDLTDNPGGYTNTLAAITSQFAGNRIVARFLNRDPDYPNETRYYEEVLEGKNGGIALDLPLIVLINKGSASASEIFAGAIQDYERGLIIGSPTLGKGVGQRSFEYGDGTVLMIPTFVWLTPNGRNIHEKGIQPDVIALPHEALAKAKQCFERYFGGEFEDIIECR